MAKYDNRFIVIDTETGGLLVKGKQATIDIALTEVALVTVDSELLEIIDKKSWLIKPYDDALIYSDGAAKVSGITKKLCKDEGLEIADVYKNIVEVFKQNMMGKKKPIVIMQNKRFDIPFMENLFAICSDKFTSYVNRIEDTMEWSRLKWPEEGKHSLGVISERCGLDHTQAHRALPDTIITAQVWIHFMQSLRGDISNSSEKSEKDKFRKGFKI